jgi:MFS family permease
MASGFRSADELHPMPTTEGFDTAVSTQAPRANQTRTQQRRVAFASCMGTTIEYYDFYIYATAAALVFPKAFFPALGTVAGTVASLGTFAVAFFARPIGAIIFGYYGDKIGRKKTLTITLLMMGIGTMLIGALPSAASIGIMAPIVLVLLRVIQGVAIGGEWAGAALLSTEYAPPNKRGLYAIYPQLGGALGYGLSCAAFILTLLTIGQSETFLQYGWRIPFLLSAVLIGIGLYLRLKIEETPVFKEELARRESTERSESDSTAKKRSPFVSVVADEPRAILVGAGSIVANMAFFFIGVTYFTSHAVGSTEQGGLGLSRVTVLTIGLIGSLFFAVATVVSGVLSDRLGRRRTVQLAVSVAFLWALVVMPLLNSGSFALFATGMVGTLTVVGLQSGYIGALLPELFRTEHRYTGAGVSFNLAAILGGAIPPLLAAPLAAAYGTGAIGVMLLVVALFSLACSFGLPRIDRATLNDDGAADTTSRHPSTPPLNRITQR